MYYVAGKVERDFGAFVANVAFEGIVESVVSHETYVVIQGVRVERGNLKTMAPVRDTHKVNLDLAKIAGLKTAAPKAKVVDPRISYSTDLIKRLGDEIDTSVRKAMRYKRVVNHYAVAELMSKIEAAAKEVPMAVHKDDNPRYLAAMKRIRTYAQEAREVVGSARTPKQMLRELQW